MGEPFVKTLTRSALAALVLGAALLLVLPRHGSLGADFVDTFTVAFCFTFLGPYVDAILRAMPDIEVGMGWVVRLAGWFAGGLWCYVVARWLWVHYGRALSDLPSLPWGGVLLIVLEPVLNRAARRVDGPAAG